MKSIKFKAAVLAGGLFAFSGAFAQDTPSTPKPDTTKAPKPDTTKSTNNTSSIMEYNRSNNAVEFVANTSFLMINDRRLAAKKEAINDIRIV